MSKLYYVAGPFRAKTLNGVQQNIDRARNVAAALAERGLMPVCVHTMEGLAMHDIQQENNGQFWVDGTLEVLRRCDAVVVCGDHRKSAGTMGEIHEAFRRGMPVYWWNETTQCGYRVTSMTSDGEFDYSTRWERV